MCMRRDRLNSWLTLPPLFPAAVVFFILGLSVKPCRQCSKGCPLGTAGVWGKREGALQKRFLEHVLLLSVLLCVALPGRLGENG